MNCHEFATTMKLPLTSQYDSGSKCGVHSPNAEHGSGLDLAQRERAVVFAHHNLVLKKSQVSIAAKFKTTQTEVSRLVRLAKAKGWIDAPGTISSQVGFLQAHARCAHIRQVVVVPTQKNTDQNMDEVSFACARYVVERARMMRAVKLGISCGNATRLSRLNCNPRCRWHC